MKRMLFGMLLVSSLAWTSEEKVLNYAVNFLAE